MQDWRSSDTDLVGKYAKNFKGFTSQLKDYIQWHTKVIQFDFDDSDYEALIVEYELMLGINVA